MTNQRTRLLAIGAFQDSMGMGRVMRHLAESLGDRYEIHYLALGCPARQIFEADGIHYYPVGIPSIRCAHYAALMVQRLQPALTLLSIEPIWLPNYLAALYRFRTATRLVGYFPLEGRFPDNSMAGFFHRMDCSVVFTRYAEAEIRRICGGSDAEVPPVSTAVIPHGVDRKRFFPLAGRFAANQGPAARRQAKQAAFPHRPDLHDGFLVLNPNLPYERKRIDLTIRGFARFARNKPAHVRLCLHHSRPDAEARRQLEQIVAAENIAERVIFSPLAADGPLSLEQLNVLYNACEVGINTAMGEGWGLTSFEHAATGAAQIVPGHTTFLENWSGAAELLTPVGTYRTTYPPFDMDVVSLESVADSLERLYADDNYRSGMARQAYERATQPEFDWQAIGDQWDGLFRRLLADSVPASRTLSPVNAD